MNNTDIAYQIGKVVNMLFTVPPIQNSPYKLRAQSPLLKDDDVKLPKFNPDTKALMTLDGAMNFILAFVNGTQLYDMANLLSCKSAVLNEWSNEAGYAKTNFTSGDFFDGLISIWSMLNNTDTVAHSCYGGVEGIAAQYFNGTSNMTTNQAGQMFYNIAFHFGTIYDNLETFYFFLMDTPYSPTMSVSDAGNLLGNVIYLALQAPVPVSQNTPSPLMSVMSVLATKALAKGFGF